MAPWGEFNGWNKLSFLPDRWHPPWSTPTEPGKAREHYAFERCWVDTAAIVERLERTRTEHEIFASENQDGNAGEKKKRVPLQTVFISTNGDDAWIKEVKDILEGAKDGWKVVTSKDLVLDWQQQGVDMAIGELKLSLHILSLRRITNRPSIMTL